MTYNGTSRGSSGRWGLWVPPLSDPEAVKAAQEEVKEVGGWDYSTAEICGYGTPRRAAEVGVHTYTS